MAKELWTFPGDLNGDGVEVLLVESADDVTYVGIRVVGPRGGYRRTAWFSDPGTVAALTEAVGSCREDVGPRA